MTDAASVTDTASHASIGPKQYWLLALLLGIVTGVEVLVLQVEVLENVRLPLLLGLSLFKFGAVVTIFMQLRFGTAAQKFVFLTGLAAATVLFAVVLLTFRAF